jgi:hypothetical protein
MGNLFLFWLYLNYVYLISCSELTATNITVTFPQKSGKEMKTTVNKVVLNPGYVPTMDSHLTIAPKNVAMLRLATPVSFTDKSKSIKKL